MIESKRPVEERAAEAVANLQKKRDALTKAENAAKLAEVKLTLARMDFDNSVRAAASKFPEQVAAAGFTPPQN